MSKIFDILNILVIVGNCAYLFVIIYKEIKIKSLRIEKQAFVSLAASFIV